jgi:hypothetical protein
MFFFVFSSVVVVVLLAGILLLSDSCRTRARHDPTTRPARLFRDATVRRRSMGCAMRFAFGKKKTNEMSIR